MRKLIVYATLFGVLLILCAGCWPLEDLTNTKKKGSIEKDNTTTSIDSLMGAGPIKTESLRGWISVGTPAPMELKAETHTRGVSLKSPLPMEGPKESMAK